MRLYYRSILEKAGFRVEEALNGLEGLEKLFSEHRPTCCIVDINMPQMDGFTFLARSGRRSSRSAPFLRW